MALNRNMQLMYLDGTVGAMTVTLGTLIDEIKAEVIADLQNDTALSKAIATAVAAHLSATVRPT